MLFFTRPILPILFVSFTGSATASTLDLFDYAVNIDGTISEPFFGDPIPAQVDTSAFDELTGLGLIQVSITGVGAHNVDLFVDHAIDIGTTSFFDEYGTAVGTAPTGLTWEIDEPGFVFGNIYDNFLISTLDNSNAVPQTFEDDVSLALGWDFILGINDTVTIDFYLSDVLNTSGFYLSQTDFFTNNQFFFWTESTIVTDTPKVPNPVPEPSMIILLVIGFSGYNIIRMRKYQTY